MMPRRSQCSAAVSRHRASERASGEERPRHTKRSTIARSSDRLPGDGVQMCVALGDMLRVFRVPEDARRSGVEPQRPVAAVTSRAPR
jgi:hypothetical protein